MSDVTRERLKLLQDEADHLTVTGDRRAFQANKYFIEQCEQYVRQLLSAPQPAEGWRPITEYVPDGNSVWLSDGVDVALGRWNRMLGFFHFDPTQRGFKPTFYMPQQPLPAPP